MKRIVISLLLLAVTVMMVSLDAEAQAKKKKSTPAPAPAATQPQPAPPPTVHQLIVNSFVSDPDLTTHLVITDLDGTSPTVHIQFYDENGTILYDKYEILAQFGKINYDMYKVLGEKKAAGTVRAESPTGRIVGQYWQFYNDPEKHGLNVALPASNGDGFSKLLCEHFGSVPDITSTLVIANTERDKPTIVNIKFYDDEGTILAMIRKVISPNGHISVPIHDTLKDALKDSFKETLVGVVYVDAEGGQHITGEYWERSDSQHYQIALPMEGTQKTR